MPSEESKISDIMQEVYVDANDILQDLNALNDTLKVAEKEGFLGGKTYYSILRQLIENIINSENYRKITESFHIFSNTEKEKDEDYSSIIDKGFEELIKKVKKSLSLLKEAVEEIYKFQSPENLEDKFSEFLSDIGNLNRVYTEILNIDSQLESHGLGKGMSKEMIEKDDEDRDEINERENKDEVNREPEPYYYGQVEPSEAERQFAAEVNNILALEDELKNYYDRVLMVENKAMEESKALYAAGLDEFSGPKYEQIESFYYSIDGVRELLGRALDNINRAVILVEKLGFE